MAYVENVFCVCVCLSANAKQLLSAACLIPSVIYKEAAVRRVTMTSVFTCLVRHAQTHTSVIELRL